MLTAISMGTDHFLSSGRPWKSVCILHDPRRSRRGSASEETSACVDDDAVRGPKCADHRGPPPGSARAPARVMRLNLFAAASVVFAFAACTVNTSENGPVGITGSGECPQGNCTQTCPAGGTCNTDCSGGNCTQTCSAGAVCEYRCAGGNCRQTCPSEAKSCALHCAGGNCEQRCLGSNCSTTCAGRNCD